MNLFICAHIKKFNNKKVKEIKRKKQIERGGFKEKIILKEVKE